MANTTTRVANSHTKFDDYKQKVPMASTAQTYYTGAMIGRNSSGYCTKFDDAAHLRFEGILADTQSITVDSGGSNGDVTAYVIKPRFVTVAIASAAAGDEGKPVFASDDQTGTYTPTTYSNFIGWVNRVISTTAVEVEAHYGYSPARAASLPYLAAATDGDVVVIFPKPVTIASAILRPEAAGTDTAAVTVAVKKAASATAIASGTAIHSGTGDLKGTAATNQALTLTSAALVSTANSAVGLDFTGTLTAAKGTVVLSVIAWK